MDSASSAVTAGTSPGLRASDTGGLTTAEAGSRLAKYGPNEPAPVQHRAALIKFLLLFTNPLVAILLIASLVSALLGERVNAFIIVSIVLVSTALDFYQTNRSQRAAEHLSEQVAPTATVLRDGKWLSIPRREVVPGDVMRLAAGDLVPADCRLIESQDLHVQQAALTGESLPVEKEAGGPSKQTLSPDDPSAVFLGTSVASGTATALVVATGRATAFGDIAARLASRPPETEFERGMRQLSLLIMRTVFFLVLFVFLVSAALHRDPLESLLFAVALAVGLTPEFLPMITTVTLGQGAVHMARRKVVVKHLAAIENLGSLDVLCSDKTGTLTSVDTSVDRFLDFAGRPSDRVLLLACLNSQFETGLKNPLDEAILRHEHPDLSGYEKLGEIPFDFERRRLSVVVEAQQERLLIAKGAPEGILAICSRLESEGQTKPLDDTARKQCGETYERLSSEGYRVLAVAYRPVEKQERYRVSDEQDMILAGFLTFANPPLPDADDMLRLLRRDGIEVKILSGDNELVTGQVCRAIGLDAGRIVTGIEIDTMSDAALAHVAEQVSVFTRVSPAQKNRIILALKARGHVVGFLGDGINDAPSIHAADVGISVANGADVAKDAADIILMEQSLRVLHNGIMEGRKAFGNVMKYLLMNVSSNFGNMFSMAGASLFLPFLPMLPTQILLNNFLYDLSQITIPTDNVDRAYIRKPRRWDIKLINRFMVYVGPISSIYDFLTFYVLLRLFHASQPLFHTGWFVESLATQTLVIFVIRTAGSPLRSRPSRALTSGILSTVLVGIALPFTPLAKPLGFAPLPAAYFVFLLGMTVTYLLLVEVVKRRLMSAAPARG